jgi:hypothetical protein
MTTNSGEGAVIGVLFTLVGLGLLFYAYRYLRGMGYVTLALGRDANKYEPDQGDVENHIEFNNVHNPMFGSPTPTNETLASTTARDELSSEQVMVDSITKSGFLSKLSSGMSREWQQRWFFIRSGRLYYCQKPSDLFGKQFIEAVCVANLLLSTVKEVSANEFQIISPGQRKGGLGGGGEYSLYSDDPAVVQDWVKFIRQQIQNQLTYNTPSAVSSDGLTANDSIFKELTSEKLTAIRALNPTCADCGAPNPDWASLNLCIVVCIECSGIHRSLGSHITKVRSLTLDKWSPNCYQLLMDVGNNYASCYWEYDGSKVLSDKPTTFAGRDVKEEFIRNKYINRRYIASSGQDPDASLLAACVKGSLIETYSALVRGASVDAASGPDRALRSALHHAVSSKNALLVELLCLWNSDVMSIDAGGKTPLKLASERNFKDITAVLSLYGGKA